ncbi:hypothetical protein MASR2M8_00200 [Opitutaceae bacterium]
MEPGVPAFTLMMSLLRSAVLMLAIASPLCALNLDSYPRQSEIVLGTVIAEIRPARTQRIKAPSSGMLHLTLPPHGTQLEAGVLWGEFEPARSRLEREAFDLAREVFEGREKPGLELDQARAHAELADRLDEIQRQSAMLTRILADPELAGLYLTGDDKPADTTAVEAMIGRLRRQEELIREVLTYVGSADQARVETRLLELKLLQQALDLKRRDDEMRLRTAFAGELTLIPPPPPPGTPLRVESGADLALLQDFSSLQARVVVKRAEWRLAEASALRVRIGAGIRGAIEGTFLRGLVEDVHGREESVYYFHLPEEKRAEARTLVGGQVSAVLLSVLPEPAHLVPKLDLALADPALFRGAGWAGGVARLFPGARVLMVGETAVAIAPAAP